ncbi:DUF397 domain-containing protein [Streptomyces sp. NPDC058469]
MHRPTSKTPQTRIRIRDSKNPTGPELHIAAPTWTMFLSGVCAAQPGA